MPFIKEYTKDTDLAKDVQKLKDNGVDKNNVYVLSHDDDRTERVAENADASTISQSFGDAVGNMFNKKGDELRSKLEEVGLSEAEATNYEKELDDGKILLIVDGEENVENVLGF